jgi:hypothetical protein
MVVWYPQTIATAERVDPKRTFGMMKNLNSSVSVGKYVSIGHIVPNKYFATLERGWRNLGDTDLLTT